MDIELPEPWRDLTFLSVLSTQRANRLVAFLAERPARTVLDLGCGWAELLLRTVAAIPSSVGVGLDTDTPAIDHGRELAGRQGLAGRVRLEVADASTASDAVPEHVDAVLAVGATHVWAPPATPADPLHYRAAFQRMRSLLPRGGRVVYGDGVWSRTPTPAATAALGGRDDEMVPLGELVALAADGGFAVWAAHEASLDEWDEFESGYRACFARWLTEHDADHPDADEVRAMARRQAERYFAGYRGVLGLAYLELEAV